MPGDYGELARSSEEYDEQRERGYRDGAAGTGFDPPYGSPAALEGYRAGYDVGADEYDDQNFRYEQG